METLDELRSLRLLIAEPGPQGVLRPVLERAGFHRTDAVASLIALSSRLQQVLRHREHDVALALVPESLWRQADEPQATEILQLADQGEVGLILVYERETDEHQLTLAREAGFVDALHGGQEPARLLERLALALSLRQERVRRRQREEHLEGELSERRVMEARLQFIAFHDELTGLYNRRRLRQALEVALLQCESFRRPCALLLLDLDRFKLVNDLEGNEVGDRLLVELSRLLVRLAQPGDAVARIGSDEFVLLLERCDEKEALRRADELRRELENYRFSCNNRYYRTCASIGVSVAAPNGETLSPGEMLSRADQACYLAKQGGRNRIHLYRGDDPQLVHLRSDFAWAPKIRDALEHGRLFFHYQPVVRIMDGEISHYEMLIRMRGADGQIHGPSEFIPAAERNGLIHEIDLWVVDQAIDFLASLPPEQNQLSVSVNLSAHAFSNRRLLSLLTSKLELHWVSPTRLVFEITETAAVENFEQGREMVARLRALGCRFALDDFGAGFSTFQYLKKFPVDYLKLDGSFIVNLRKDPIDQELVRHMISVGHSLGKKIVAEFIEDAETYRLLRGLGIDYAQGHYLGEAAPELVDRSALPPEVRREAVLMPAEAPPRSLNPPRASAAGAKRVPRRVVKP